METFRRWRQRLSDASVPATAPHPSAPFVEIAALPSRPAGIRNGSDDFVAEIATPGGCTVRIRASIAPVLLREVLSSC